MQCRWGVVQERLHRMTTDCGFAVLVFLLVLKFSTILSAACAFSHSLSSFSTDAVLILFPASSSSLPSLLSPSFPLFLSLFILIHHLLSCLFSFLSFCYLNPFRLLRVVLLTFIIKKQFPSKSPIVFNNGSLFSTDSWDKTLETCLLLCWT